MAAVWYRFRAELRARWRAWIGLALLLGFAAGVVAAVAVGARRTSTVATRFHRELAGFDVYVENYPDPTVALIDPADVEALPMVASSARVRLDYGGPGDDSVIFTAPDDRLGTVLQRAKVLDGRLPDPARADEVAIATGSEDQLGRVGDEARLLDPEDYDEPVRPLVHVSTVRVVGIVAVPNAVVMPRGAAPGGTMFGTPALHAQLKATMDAEAELRPDEVVAQPDGVMARLRNGSADVPAFRAELEKLANQGELSFQRSTELSDNLHRSMRLQSVTLWLLAGLLGIVGLASIIATMRQSANVDSEDASTLRALGLTSRDLVALSVLRGAFVGVAGVIVAGTIALVLSPRVLFGLARDIEPNQGITVDTTVLVVTLIAVVVLALVASVINGVFARRPRIAGVRQVPVLRVPPATNIPAGVGVRFACSGWSLLGRGIAGPAIGIAALTGALVFSASLAHLRSEPDLYGWRWDTVATNYDGLPPDSIDPGSDEGLGVLRSHNDIESAAVGHSVDVRIQEEDVPVVTLDVVRGTGTDVLPTIVEGDAPTRPGEIALASGTMSRLRTQIGGRLEVTAEDAPQSMAATVVGRVVIPPLFGDSDLDEGALMPDRSTFERLGVPLGGEPEQLPAVSAVFLRLAPGADGDAVIASLNEAFGGDYPQLYEVPRVQPQDLVDFGRVDGFPLLLGGVLAVLAASTLVHVLVSSVRLRRRDLATLRAMGVRRAELGGVIAAQATFLALLALIVGIPLGILAGRTAWSVYANNTGFISVVQVPALAVLVLAVVAIVVAEMCAAVPARLAARTRPAQLLRSE